MRRVHLTITIVLGILCGLLVADRVELVGQLHDAQDIGAACLNDAIRPRVAP
jgi:hypothetical protein